MAHNPPSRHPSAADSAGSQSPGSRPSTIEIRRSSRRRRTVSAYRDGDRTIVLLPARMSKADERRWVEEMLARLDAQERRRGGRAVRGDVELAERAAELSGRYLGGVARPSSVRWVGNQLTRWGSCTPGDRTIRLSDRMRSMPGWVVDYVLVHELAHLIEIGHGPRFQALVDRYPKAERARGYLLGITAAVGGLPAPTDGSDDDDSADGSDADDIADDSADGSADGFESGLDTSPHEPVARPVARPAARGSTAPQLW